MHTFKARLALLEMTKVLFPIETVVDGHSLIPFYVQWMDVEPLLKDLLASLNSAMSDGDQLSGL